MDMQSFPYTISTVYNSTISLCFALLRYGLHSHFMLTVHMHALSKEMTVCHIWSSRIHFCFVCMHE